MRNMLYASAALLVVALAAAISWSADTSVTGVLIDQACGAKMMSKDNPETAAADHTRACAMKDACSTSGYAVISGKKLLKFDDNGNKLAKDFLAKSTSDKDLKVTVMGTEKDGTIAVTSIKAAP